MATISPEAGPTIRPFVRSDRSSPASEAQLDTILLLTIAWLLVYPPNVAYAAAAAQAVAIPGIVARSVRRSPWFWAVLAVLTFIGVGVNRLSADNHRYLAAYWCLAIAVALVSARRVTILASNARYLVAGSFVFAVIWKTQTVDFLDGRFFEAQLLTDPRFSWVAQYAGQLSAHALASNSTVMGRFVDPASTAATASITTSAGVMIVAYGLTYAIYVIELVIALAFFARPTGFLGQWRQDLLCVFILVTYAAAPVYSYGWLLAILGLASASPKDKVAKHAFVGAIVIVQSYSLFRTSFA